MRKTSITHTYKIRIPKVAKTEVCEKFLQRMADAMGISFFKYGKVADSKGKTDYLRSAQTRIDLYENGGTVKGNKVEPGNIWYLADAANFLMMEAMNPTVPDAEWGVTSLTTRRVAHYEMVVSQIAATVAVLKPIKAKATTSVIWTDKPRLRLSTAVDKATNS